MRKALDNISTILLHLSPLALAFFSPLFFYPWSSDPFNLSKIYLVSFLATIALLAWCIQGLVHKKVTITPSPSLVPLLFLTIAFVLSSLWLSPIPQVSLLRSTTLIISLALIFLTATATTNSQRLTHQLIVSMVTSISLLSLITILHQLGIFNRFIQSEWLTNNYFNPSGGLITAIAITAPVVFGTLAYLIFSKNWSTRIILGVAIFIMTIASVINLNLLQQSYNQSKLIVLPLRASWSVSVDTLKNWKTALLGSGPETYPLVYTRLKPKYVNQDQLLWRVRFPESGSFFLTLLTTTGLIGAAFFFLTFTKPIITITQHVKEHSRSPQFIFLSLSLITLFLSLLLLPLGPAALSFCVALLIALTLNFKTSGLTKNEDLNLSLSIRQQDKQSVLSHLLPLTVTIISIILVSFYWLRAVPIFQATIYSKQAESLIKTSPVSAYLKVVNANKLDKFNTNYPLSLSQFFKSLTVTLLTKTDPTPDDKKNATDYMQKSIDYAKLAAQINPADVSVWENLADIYQTYIGSADGAHNFAISHLAQAISLDPINPELRLRLGLLFYNLGDADQGIKLVGQAMDLKPNWDLLYYNLSAMYKSKKDYQRALQYLQLGMQYTNQNSETYQKVVEELHHLEKLTSPQEATPSTQTKTK